MAAILRIAGLFWLPAILGLIGLVATLIGIRGFRRPHTPSCPACNRPLPVPNVRRCPACGAVLAICGPTRAPRRPSFVLIVLGLLAVGATGVALRSAIHAIDWYTLEPISVALRELGDYSRDEKAWKEIRRRQSSGELSASDLRAVVKRCLAEQNEPIYAYVVPQLIWFLDECYDKGALTVAESQQFRDHILCLRLKARSPVAVGDRVCVAIDYEPRGLGGFDRKITVSPPTFGHPDPGPKSATGDAQHVSGYGGTINWIEAPVAGEHTVRQLVTIEASALGSEPGKGRLDFRVTRVLEAPVVVLAEEPPDLVQAIDDPGIADSLRASLEATLRRDEQGACELEITIDDSPVTLACDVYLRLRGGELHIGELVCDYCVDYSSTHGFRGVSADETTYTLILRGSREVAKDTIDVFEYWAGELVLPNLPIERSSHDDP